LAKKSVLIVDDSALVRKQLNEILEEYFEIDFAKNGEEAVQKALEYDYSVITMDLRMPKIDGLEATRRIMKENPTPILIISSATTDGARETMQAMDYGAVDYISKESARSIADISSMDIVRKVKAVSRISKRRLCKKMEGNERRQYVSNVNLGAPISSKVDHLVLIGSSTGGPGLIEQICKSLPSNFPHPVCIVQHMPEKFTKPFADRINKDSLVTVKESEHGEDLKNGFVYIAKGGVNLTFQKKISGKIVIKHTNEVEGRYFTPSVDEMFLSAVEVVNPIDITAFVLTGIGEDGAEGSVVIKDRGGFTIGESAMTATVYGMPREAKRRGGINEELPFPKILGKFTQFRG
jgi:two-component system chemotaxis response regulator CheB